MSYHCRKLLEEFQTAYEQFLSQEDSTHFEAATKFASLCDHVLASMAALCKERNLGASADERLTLFLEHKNGEPVRSTEALFAASSLDGIRRLRALKGPFDISFHRKDGTYIAKRVSQATPIAANFCLPSLQGYEHHHLLEQHWGKVAAIVKERHPEANGCSPIWQAVREQIRPWITNQEALALLPELDSTAAILSDQRNCVLLTVQEHHELHKGRSLPSPIAVVIAAENELAAQDIHVPGKKDG